MFFVFLNNALIQWFFEKQATIETSVFGAEFVVMKIVMETLQGKRYKLRMIGLPMSGPSNIYAGCICYHAVCESIAMGESLAEPIGVDENCAELITKV